MRIGAFKKTYAGRTVLDFPDFELKEGNIYAVIGANGCGKSTLAKVLSGVLRADSGRAPLEGVEVGYMPQKNFAFRMTTRANIMLAGSDKARCERLMERLDLTHLANTRAQSLSGGETARMALARLCMATCALLLLDEPTAAMDIASTHASEALIRDYAQETHATVLLITHSLAQAARLADELLFLDKGQLVEYGSKESLLHEPKTQALKRFIEFYEA